MLNEIREEQNLLDLAAVINGYARMLNLEDKYSVIVVRSSTVDGKSHYSIRYVYGGILQGEYEGIFNELNRILSVIQDKYSDYLESL